MGRRGKSIGAAAKKSRRHLEGMQATRSKAPPVARGECLSLPVDDSVEIKFRTPHAIDAVTVTVSARWRGYSTPSTRRYPRECGRSMAWRFTKT